MTALRRVPDAAISEPNDYTVMDSGGAVRSIQAANVTMPEGELDELWTPLYLERLARTYWKYLSRVSLGLIRVEYTPRRTRVVLLRRPFVLLRFGAPEYEITEGRGIVRWRIRDGVLVAKRNEGYLEIDVRKAEAPKPGYAQAHVEVEVANFYPRDRHLGRALVLQGDPVAHPRARHARVPALARPPRARGERRRALRDRPPRASRSTSARRRGSSSAPSSRGRRRRRDGVAVHP